MQKTIGWYVFCLVLCALRVFIYLHMSTKPLILFLQKKKKVKKSELQNAIECLKTQFRILVQPLSKPSSDEESDESSVSESDFSESDSDSDSMSGSGNDLSVDIGLNMSYTPRSTVDRVRSYDSPSMRYISANTATQEKSSSHAFNSPAAVEVKDKAFFRGDIYDLKTPTSHSLPKNSGVLTVLRLFRSTQMIVLFQMAHFGLGLTAMPAQGSPAHSCTVVNLLTVSKSMILPLGRLYMFQPHHKFNR